MIDREKLAVWASSNAAGLVVCGAATIARGMSYFSPLVNQERKAAHYLETMLPPVWWGVIWVAFGLVCVVAATSRRFAPQAVGLCVGIHAAWGMSFLAVQLFEPDKSRAWVSSLSYWLICFLIVWGFSRRRPITVEIVGR